MAVSGGGIGGASNRYSSNEKRDEKISFKSQLGGAKYGEYATERKNVQASCALFSRGGALARSTQNQGPEEGGYRISEK